MHHTYLHFLPLPTTRHSLLHRSPFSLPRFSFTHLSLPHLFPPRTHTLPIHQNLMYCSQCIRLFFIHLPITIDNNSPPTFILLTPSSSFFTPFLYSVWYHCQPTRLFLQELTFSPPIYNSSHTPHPSPHFSLPNTYISLPDYLSFLQELTTPPLYNSSHKPHSSPHPPPLFFHPLQLVVSLPAYPSFLQELMSVILKLLQEGITNNVAENEKQVCQPVMSYFVRYTHRHSLYHHLHIHPYPPPPPHHHHHTNTTSTPPPLTNTTPSRLHPHPHHSPQPPPLPSN